MSIAVTLSIGAAARPSPQSSGVGSLIQKAKEKLAKLKIVECARTDQVCIDNARKAGATVKLIEPPAGPVPTSGQPSRASGQMPPSAPARNQTAGSGFEAPEPDYASLFKLVMAANADVLGNDKGAAWDHYLLFRVPPGVAPGRLNPECMNLQAKLRNELTAETMLNNARADFNQALLTAPSAPKTAQFKLQTKEHLAAYDSATNAFRLETINSSMLVRNPVFNVSRFRDQSAPGPCYATGAIPTWLQPSIWGFRANGEFTLEIEGHDSLGEDLPMDRASAETFLNANPEKLVDLQLVVDVGPAPLKQAPRGHAIPARIVAARLLSPRDARVLHTFNVGAAGMTSAATPGAAAASQSGGAGDAVLFTANRGVLLTVRDQPARITPEVLLQATRNQVGIEQRVWRQVDLLKDPKTGGVPANRWNPKRAVFTYEWQTVMERQPEVASGPVLDLFLRPDPDWSIVTRDPAWDTRFVAIVVPTLFARDKVEGRDPSFAAQELAPVYKRHLEMAVSKAPTKLWIPMTLPPYTYDFAAREIRFAAQARGPKPSTIGGSDLPLLADDGTRGMMEYVLPPASRGLATYPVSGFGAVMQRAEPAPTKPGNLAVLDATDAWRHAFAIGSSYRAMPMVEVLAFDRRIQIASLPTEPARAEALAKHLTSNPASRLTARVYFDAERVEIGERVFDNDRSTTAVLVGKVQRVEILDFDNAVIATVAAAALPPPAVATAPSAPAARAPVPAAATPRRPTAAEIEADIQRKNAADAQRVLDALHRTIEDVKPPTAATAEKDKNCRAQAAKVNKDPQSKPYRDAYAACQAAR